MERLTDSEVREPSLLPEWTRAHVLTHIARAADSRTRLLTAARTGAQLPQYLSEEERSRQIEAGPACLPRCSSTIWRGTSPLPGHGRGPSCGRLEGAGALAGRQPAAGRRGGGKPAA
ncbi:maleylpyruvate isomerase N-terminal domain-containing protein [Streptacidiphilus monticola]